MTRKDSNKANLIVAVQNLLQQKTVGTQEEIKIALQKQGFVVNQVKISRLLHKIGAVKISEGGQIVYRLPTELVSITTNDSLKQLILNISHNGTLIVIQTAPGSAQFVARLLDQTKELGILGTVAGDDTIFIAPKTSKFINKIQEKIHQLLLA